ncbi:hypothetical protein ACFXTO_000100 [Malus domestica]
MIKEDHCVYLKKFEKNTILSLYVDDILIARNDKTSIQITKVWLSSHFEMRDMGEAHYVLGVKITKGHSRKLLSLSQKTYIKKVLERFKMKNSKPHRHSYGKSAKSSLEQCPKIKKEKEQMTNIPYAFVVGSLMYAMLCMRPDKLTGKLSRVL